MYAQPNFINLHPNEYIQRICYYSFAASLGRCTGSCNTGNDTFDRLCLSIETSKFKCF